MISTTNSELITTNYSYDGLGRRVQKQVNGAKTRYVYDNEGIAFEYNGNNQIQASYVHGAGIDEPLSMTRGADTYYYLTDGLGSITQLVNSSGNIIKSYAYDSFGNVLSETGTLANPFAFTARERDPESGLYFYRARYYDPTLGRFLQEDPVKGLKDWPVTLNLYPYVVNNPANLTDSSGESIITCVVVATVIGLTLFLVVKSMVPNMDISDEIRRRQGTTGLKDIEDFVDLEEQRCENIKEGVCKLKVGTEALGVSTLTTPDSQAVFIIQKAVDYKYEEE